MKQQIQKQKTFRVRPAQVLPEQEIIEFDQEQSNDVNQTQIIAYEDLSRRDVRSLIFHLLYAVDAFEYQESLQSIVDMFCDGYNLVIPRHSEAFSVVNQIIAQKDMLDKQYEPLLSNWRIERISVCIKLILRFAIWELNNTDIDHRIIINEAIELAKCFAEKDAYKFINGVLDKAAKNL